MENATFHLSDLCHLVSEPIKPGERPDALYLGLEHLASGRLVRTGGGQAANMRSTTSEFRPDDVLYGKLRPYLDKAVLADKAGVCSTELLVLRAKAGVDPRFLAVVVHSPNFLEYAVAGTTGVQHPRTSWAHTREFEVPAFTFDEQRQIASFLWLVHEAISRSEALIEEGQTLKRAAMQKLFTSGLHGEPQKETEIGPVPESWEVKPLSACADKPDYGYTTSASDELIGPRLLRITDIKDGYVDWDVVPFCKCSREIAASKGLHQNDIVVARIGATTGKSYLIDRCPEAIFASYLIRIRAYPDKVDPGFLYYYMQTSRYWRYIDYNKGGRLKGGINIPILESLSLPRPTLNEQREIVSILEAIDRKIDLHRRKRTVLDELFKALLHKLMTGEIRVTDLNLSAVTGKTSNP